jgi:hypothetical protein
MQLPPLLLSVAWDNLRPNSIIRIVTVIRVFHRQHIESTPIEPAPGMHGLHRRLKKFLRDECRHECAQDHHAYQDRVLALVDDLFCSPNSAEIVPKVNPVAIRSVV